MLSTQVMANGQVGVSRWLVPGGLQIGRPTYLSYNQVQQQLPLPVTGKRPPQGCRCHPCLTLLVLVVTLLLFLTVALPLIFQLPRGPGFTEDITVEVSTLEYPYIENLLQRDPRLFYSYESGFCRNFRMIIIATSYQTRVDYRDCKLEAISQYHEWLNRVGRRKRQAGTIGSTFTFKLTMESSSQITRFTVVQVLDAIIKAVTAGEVGGRLLLYLEGTRVLTFPGLRDPVFPATVDVYLQLSIGVPGVPFVPNFEQNNPQEFQQLQTTFCEHMDATFEPITPPISVEECSISSIEDYVYKLKSGRRRRQASGILIKLEVRTESATAGLDTEALADIVVSNFAEATIGNYQTSVATVVTSVGGPVEVTTTAPPTLPPEVITTIDPGTGTIPPSTSISPTTLDPGTGTIPPSTSISPTTLDPGTGTIPLSTSISPTTLDPGTGTIPPSTSTPPNNGSTLATPVPTSTPPPSPSPP